MANNNNKLQKILIKPPLKGLNMHDNPLDLDYTFATELTNFQPPTTKLEVRPGIVNIMQLSGISLGLYSYSVGARKIYKTGTIIRRPGIESPAYSFIIIKLQQINGISFFMTINPLTKDMSGRGEVISHTYNSDYAMYENSMFFVDGSNVSSPYIFSGEKGLNSMVWLKDQNDNSQLTDIENMVVYNGYLFANSKSTLNIHFMKADTADPNSTSSNWFNRIFAPKCLGHININGVLRKGGVIMSMFTLSANQHDNLQGFFCVLTSLGELLVYQGTNPADATKWNLLGDFQIPVPLNKRCICFVEGDVIIATVKGFFSMHRVIFGKMTSITESLEWRISSLFDEYEFRMNSFKNYFFLKYFPKNRQLFFNVPQLIPSTVYDLARGFVFDKDTYISFDVDYLKSEENYLSFTDFLVNYILKRGINYSVQYVFNEDDNLGIFLDFIVTLPGRLNPDGVYVGEDALITVKYYIVTLSNAASPTPTTKYHKSSFIGGYEGDVFVNSWQYIVKDYWAPIRENIVPYVYMTDWIESTKNPLMQDFQLPTDRGDVNSKIFSFVNSPQKSDGSYEITSIVPKTTNWGEYSDLNVLKDMWTGTLCNTIGFLYFDRENFVNPYIGYDDYPPFNNYGENGKVPSYRDFMSALGRNYSQGFNYQYTPGDPQLIFYRLPCDTKGLVPPFEAHLLEDYSKRLVFDLSFKNITPIKNNEDVLTGEAIYIRWSCNVYESYTASRSIWSGVWESYINRECNHYATIGFTSSEGIDKDLLTIQGQYTCEFNCTDPDNSKADPKWAYGRIRKESGNIFTTEHVSSIYACNIPMLSKKFGEETFLNDFTYHLYNSETYSQSEIDYIKDYYSKGRDSDPYSQASTTWRRTQGNLLMFFRVTAIDIDNSFVESSNFDMSMVPLLNAPSVVCNYKSSQYVFDTHYGTWSKYEDIDMVDAIEHETEFYFLRIKNRSLPEPTNNSPAAVVYDFEKVSMLCKFDPDSNGDFYDKETGESTPIKVLCQGGHTDIAIGQLKKQFKSVDVFGTKSVFWSANATVNSPVFLLSYSLDFVDQEDQIYPYFKYDVNDFYKEVFARLNKKGITKTNLQDMTYLERKEFNRVYAAVSSQVKFISMPLVSTPCTRISLGFKLNVVEHNLLIYGYELFYEAVNP
jgi:hypothetical protein